MITQEEQVFIIDVTHFLRSISKLLNKLAQQNTHMRQDLLQSSVSLYTIVRNLSVNTEESYQLSNVLNSVLSFS